MGLSEQPKDDGKQDRAKLSLREVDDAEDCLDMEEYEFEE
jgi:hypothetical protein